MLNQQNLTDLRDKGYTVVPGVIPARDCDTYIGQYNRWVNSFGENRWPKTAKSLIRGYNTGNLEPTWRVRLQAKGVFSELWKTEKLLTSVDAIAIGRPPEEGAELFDDGSTHWLHLDQENARQGLHAYQGSVFLEEAGEDDWTLQVMEHSHNYFADFFKAFENARAKSLQTNFFRLNQTHVKYFKEKGCQIKRVPAPKGAMLLWDSRLVHANAQPKLGREFPRWRYVVFVSMTPAIWASHDDIIEKQKVYSKTLMTNHWSSAGATILNETPASKAYPKERPDIASTPEVRRLAGVIPYDFEDDQPNGPPAPIWAPGTGRELQEKFLELSRKDTCNIASMQF